MRKTTKMVAVLAAMSVMVLGAATMVSAAEKQGWVKEGSDWYYYNKDEKLVNGWAQDGAGLWYFLGEEGKMAEEKFVDNSAELTVTPAEVVLGDYTDYYYVGKGGAMVTGWAEIKLSGTSGPTGSDTKAWYYFAESGLMYADEWILSGDTWYWVEEDGKMVKNYLLANDDENYYFNKDGAMIVGWYKTTDKDESSTSKNEVSHNFVEDKWIYANASGELQNGWEKVNGSWYHFGSVLNASSVSGGAITGTATGETFLMNADTFIQAGSETFYLKSSGAMATGLFKIRVGSGSTAVDNYYLADTDGNLLSEVQKVSGKNYFFDASTFVRDEVSKYVTYDGTTYAPQADVAPYNADSTAKAQASSTNHVYKLGTGTIWK